MTLKAISASFGEGGLYGPDVRDALVELQGLNFSPVTGASNGTKMNIAMMRTEDTILSAMLQGGVTTPAVSEVQHVAVAATGGNWTLTSSIGAGGTTGNLASTVSAAALQTALEALALWNVGDVVVTGGPGDSTGSTPYILTYAPYLGNVPEVTGASVTLTGTGTVTPSTVTPGVQQVGGLFTDDKANITIQDTHATGTLTITGTPSNAETFVVNGTTYTFKTTPTAATDILINTVASSVGYNAMTASVANAINTYENRVVSSGGVGGRNVPQVTAAVTSAGVTTITSVADGVGNGVVVTGTITVLAAATSGTASATLTAASVVATNAATVSGVVFTARAAPTLANEFLVTTTTDAAQANEIARCINEYDETYGTLDVKASTTGTTGVVTLVPRSVNKGNIITLTESVTGMAASGSGVLAGGTATGGIKSTTDLTGESLLVVWFNKHP